MISDLIKARPRQQIIYNSWWQMQLRELSYGTRFKEMLYAAGLMIVLIFKKTLD